MHVIDQRSTLLNDVTLKKKKLQPGPTFSLLKAVILLDPVWCWSRLRKTHSPPLKGKGLRFFTYCETVNVV